MRSARLQTSERDADRATSSAGLVLVVTSLSLRRSSAAVVLSGSRLLGGDWSTYFPLVVQCSEKLPSDFLMSATNSIFQKLVTNTNSLDLYIDIATIKRIL